MIADFIEKIAAQKSFDSQVEIAENTFAAAVGSGGEFIPSYVLTEREEERLKGIDMEKTVNEFFEKFEVYCRDLYGKRWVGRND